MKPLQIFFIISILIASALSLSALSMQEAIDKALQYSAKIQSQKSYISAATYNKYSTYANFLPVVGSTYMYSFNAPVSRPAIC